MHINKKTIHILLYIIAIVFLTICFFIGFKYSHSHTLKKFNFKVENINNEIIYTIDGVKASYYEIIIISDEEEKVIKVTDNKGKLNLDLAYQEMINIKAKAYYNGEAKKSSLITFTSSLPSFNKDNLLYLTKDSNILLDGKFDNNYYELVVKYNDENIYQTLITSNKVLIPYDKISNYMGRLSISIISNNKVITTKNFYVNTTLIGAVTITRPITEHLVYDDFYFAYEGGANANNFELKIYENKKVVKIISLKNKETKISIKDLKPKTMYTLELVATYNDYIEIASTDSINFTTTDKNTVSKVYTTTNFLSLKPNSKLTLATKTSDAKILYTIDGTNPKSGMMYTEPITITKNTTLRAIAIKNNMTSSPESTFNVVVKDKTPVIYLSPSNQSRNYGVAKVGYSNEREMMNKVADVVERKLKEGGAIVYRNNPNKRMDTWLAESNKVKSDLHLAIHSNGSVSHKIQGMEIYVHDENSLGYSVAEVIYNDLYKLYPYQNEENGRGVLFARGRMGEVHPLNIKVGVLLEIAYHDQKKDAAWIVQNIDEIGESIAKSVLKYFQVN